MIPHTTFGAVATAIVLSLPYAHSATTATFEDFVLPTEGFWRGDTTGTPAGPGPWGGTQYIRDLTFQGAPNANFRNIYTDYGGGFGTWTGFAVSNRTDLTTTGLANQYSVFAGSGAGGSSQFMVSYGTTNSIRFAGPTSMLGAGASFTNTTYAALDMMQGSGFSKQFTPADWFKLTITGYQAGSATGSTELFLASFGNILNTWQHVDFSTLGTVDELRFEMTSSDTDPVFGMNTPAYFALDNLVVPEPSSVALASLGLCVLLRRRRVSNWS